MTEMMDVIDQSGNRLRITRTDYSEQVMDAARQNWNNIQFFRQVTPQLLNEGFVDEALELAERACELSGGHIPDLYWKAAALAESGELDRAGDVFAEVQEDAAYPADQARAAMGLARVRARQQREDEAEKLLEWAANTDPDNPQYLVLLYGFYNERNKADDGLERVKKLASKIKTKATGYRALMQIAASRSEIEEARRYADEALKMANDMEKQSVLAEMSWHYGQAKMPEEIVTLLAPQIEEVKHPLALMNLVQAYIDTDRRENALKLLQALDKSAPPELKPMVEAKLKELNEPECAVAEPTLEEPTVEEVTVAEATEPSVTEPEQNKPDAI